MPLIAVLSNPNSNGNRRHLPRIREFCADRPDVMSVEVPSLAALRPALDRIVAAEPDVLVINGGDGTIQAVLTEIHAGEMWDRKFPPIAIMPGGRTNLIAKDMGAGGDLVQVLQRVIDLTERGLGEHISTRQLISLSTGEGERPTYGMFLAAGWLADIMLWCRHKLYSTGMPTWLAHFITLFGGLISVVTGWGARFLPPPPEEADISVGGRKMRAPYQVLMVSTLRALVLWGKAPPSWPGTLCLISLEAKRSSVARAVWAVLTGKLGREAIPGVGLTPGNEIRFGEAITNVIMDGESFVAKPGETITLHPSPSMRFVDLRSRVRAAASCTDETPGYVAARSNPAAVSSLSDARAHSRHR